MIDGHYKSHAPSGLSSWYHHQDKLRSERKLNGLDVNEIKSAFYGVMNKWYKFVTENEKEAKEFIQKPDQERYRHILGRR